VNVDRTGDHLEAFVDKLLAAAQGVCVEAGRPQEGALEQAKDIVIGAGEGKGARDAFSVVGQGTGKTRIAWRSQVAPSARAVEAYQPVLTDHQAHGRKIASQGLRPTGRAPGHQGHDQPDGLQLFEQPQGARGQLATRGDGVIYVCSQNLQSG
jgi:hypothetical protein